MQASASFDERYNKSLSKKQNSSQAIFRTLLLLFTVALFILSFCQKEMYSRQDRYCGALAVYKRTGFHYNQIFLFPVAFLNVQVVQAKERLLIKLVTMRMYRSIHFVTCLAPQVISVML